MAKQTLQPKKKRGPAPTGIGTPIQVRLQPSQLARLDAWIAVQPEPQPTRPQAIRAILDAGLGKPDRERTKRIPGADPNASKSK